MPKFFGYEQEIKVEMERQGAVVDWLPDRPFDSSVLKALTKLRPEWLLPYTDACYESLLTSFGASTYSKIFVVNGQTLSYKFLSKLRSTFPAAEVILYMWDSIKNRPNIIKNLPLFDKVFSFDVQSIKDYGFHHRPLFFSPGFKPSTTNDLNYGLSFIGTAHSDRYGVISKVKDALPVDVKTFWYLYLQAPWVFNAYKFTNPNFKHAKKSDFNFNPLDKSIVQTIFSKSFAILDIEHPHQTGLTMRSLEAFGSHKKLVTTNQSVGDYEFYNSNNICIIDRQTPKIPSAFFKEPFIPALPKVYERYSLRGWVNEIFK
jgi:hypothetical protein